MQVNFIQKAERENVRRAERYVLYRRSDVRIGITCALIAVSIYLYTIYAIKQEKFLDDFEMPDPLLPVDNESAYKK